MCKFRSNGDKHYSAVEFSGRRQLRQLLVEAIFKLQQPESEPVLDLSSGYATLRMQLQKPEKKLHSGAWISGCVFPVTVVAFSTLRSRKPKLCPYMADFPVTVV